MTPSSEVSPFQPRARPERAVTGAEAEAAREAQAQEAEPEAPAEAKRAAKQPKAKAWKGLWSKPFNGIPFWLGEFTILVMGMFTLTPGQIALCGTGSCDAER